MYPFRRILIPTDFSTAAEWVFDDAVRVAGSTGAEIVILHIRMTWESHPSELRLPADPALYEYAEQQELERLRDRVRRANATVETRLAVKQGPDPGAEICRSAAEENADLIVIATHARHHVAHLLIGSTTLKVLTDPPAPVLAIRYGIRKREGMQRILVPVHPKQTTHAALDLATAIAAHEEGEVHLLTVCDEGTRPDAEATLRELQQWFPNAKTDIVRGTDVDREIIRYADKSESDVIFINATQQLGEKKLNIVRHASTPVMIVPAPPTQ
jgi:nucleotide-binding universal stress UspA family protein